MSQRLLIDSHVFLWLNEGPARLSPAVAQALAEPDAEVWLSSVAVAELCIKNALGKLPLPAPVERDAKAGFREAMARMRIACLDLTFDHVTRLRDLPRHHGDPFDRLMIAQALEEGLTLVTHDRAFGSYSGLVVMWV